MACGILVLCILSGVLGGCARPRRTVAAHTPGASAPPSSPAPPPTTRAESLSGPHFAFNQATLTPEGQAKVRGAAQMLKRYPDRGIEVSGYTDSTENDTRNRRLSERRAEAVKEILVESGVSASRITTAGYGAANPVASNATAEGRAQNRRVEIVLE
jgi:outer membrane protein OmpA-like peptidoglycan-associated protein